MEIEFEIPAEFTGKIIGKGGATIKGLQNEFRCRIKITQISDSISMCRIAGQQHHLESARDKIKGIIDEEVRRVESRPNVFLAIQFENPEILEKINEIQSDAIEMFEGLSEYKEGSHKAHITLLVAKIENMDDAIAVLQKTFEDKVKNEFDPLTIGLKGLSSLNGGKVVYVKPDERGVEDVCKIESIFRDDLLSAGFNVQPHKDAKLNPHVTIFKYDYDKRIKDGVKMMKDAAKHLVTFSDLHFGSQEVVSVQLCKISKDSEEHKEHQHTYYHKYAEFFF